MRHSFASSRWWLYLTVPLCLLLSAYFIFLTYTYNQTKVTVSPPTLNKDWYDIDTARQEILQHSVMVGNCHLCHAYWVAIPRSAQTINPRFAHANLKLNHGSNDRCYNCHSIADRNSYVADDGASIMVQTPEQLCRRCHGLIFNDWKQGTHGKWTGSYTNQTLFSRVTYSCTQCHDPHNPAFKYHTVAPPPTWPDKYIRTNGEHKTVTPLKNFFIDGQPEEIFLWHTIIQLSPLMIQGIHPA